MTTPNRSETFGRLLKAGIASIANCEGKTAPVVEDDLGTQIGVVGKSIQRYKAGALPPDPRTVQILADACVKRGMMGREWLEAFLHHARYPFADKLLDQLRPLGPIRPRPPRVYENLPAPTYSQFVMRPQAFAEIADGLGKRTAAVLIVGLGGNGKTSLAREVAAHCLRDDDETPRFDSVVWVSDKDRPGTTNLSTVLDEIARTLDYPGFTQFEHDEKRREVEQLLRRQKVLVVVDNFETISDGSLLTWLLNLPEPSKALITSREYRREWRSSWPVELRGMSESEAWDLVSERARVLKIDRLIGERTQLEPLLVATGGNPKALTMTLGLLKYERRPLQEVVDDLYAARGDLFDDLFTRAWALLDEAARRVLLVATFFPASASGEALSVTADVQSFAFDRAVERLADLSLLDVQQEDLRTPPRYVLHPLVRAFAGVKLVEQPGFEEGARERWVGWYMVLAQQVGWCWQDPRKLTLLDREQEVSFQVLLWCANHARATAVLELAANLSYYYHVRGLWDKKTVLEHLRAQAAHALNDINGEVIAYSFLIQVLARQDKLTELEPHLTRLRALADLPALTDESRCMVHETLAFYWMAQQAYGMARDAWHRSLPHTEQHEYHTTRRQLWLAVCLHRLGAIADAEGLLHDVLTRSTHLGRYRSIIGVKLRLAELALDNGHVDAADLLLEAVRAKAADYQDRENLALFQPLAARLHTLRGDLPAARASLAEAIDRFERLGMRRELAEARAELARLDASDAPIIGASEA